MVHSTRLRQALLSSAAVGALLIAASGLVQAQVIPPAAPCDNISGGGAVVTCSGNVATGVLITSPTPYQVLNVNNLTANIAPAANVSGISFTSSGAITVNSDTTGTAGTITTGATGIYARSTAASVTVISTGDISTTGNSAYGIRIRSGTAAVTVTSSGTISTTGQGAQGISAWSYGAGMAAITFTGNISTKSAYANGLAAFSQTGTVAVVSTGDITTEGAFAKGIDASSFGGTITVTSTGNISTTGLQADGIQARSLGAGAATVTQTGGSVTSTLGRGIFARSSTGAVEVTTSGAVQAGSQGIFARSYGAGTVNVNQTAGSIVSTANQGIFAQSNTGAISVSTSGTVQAQQAGIFARNYGAGALTVTQTGGSITSNVAQGIVAQSSTGAISVTTAGAVQGRDQGIFAVNTGGAPGTVTVTQTGGSITSTGGGTAGSAVNVAGQGTNLNVNIAGITTGATGFAGVEFGLPGEFRVGASNTLTNSGTIQNSGGINQLAILGRSGNEAVTNSGVIIGSVNLGGGVNSFTNQAGGVFASGTTVNLGAGNLFTNSGTLSSGGVGAIQTTALTGNLVQTGTGRFAVDLDVGVATADKIAVTGPANLAGTVVVTPTNLAPGANQVTIVSAAGGTTDAGLGLTASPALQAQLLYPNANDVVLAYSINFSVSGLTANQTSVGNYLNAGFAAGGGGLDSIFTALLDISTVQGYQAALDRLHPEHYLSHLDDTLHSSLFFLNAMMSCPTPDGLNIEGRCYWFKAGGRTFDWDRTNSNIGGDQWAINASGGVQMALEGNWRLGLGFSYEDTDIRTNNAASTDGQRIETALVLKNRWGATSVATAVFAGYGWFDTQRTIGLAGIGETKGKHDVAFGGVHARFSHDFAMGVWYVRPQVDLNATYLSYGNFQETGGGAANLSVHGGDDWVFSVGPALQIGAQHRIANGFLFSPYLRAGVILFDDMHFAMTSSFISAPQGITPFTVTSEFDKTFVDVSAGVDVLAWNGINAKLNYEGRLGKHSDMHAGGLKVSVPF